MITLYHGTSTRHKEAILKNGLLPRNVTGVSNWSEKIESKPGFIYLSDAYPVYFALQAAQKADEECLILEIGVNEKDLYPDEDYIAQCLHFHDPIFQKMPLVDINPLIDLEDYRQYWNVSLKHNGNVAIKKVRPSQIKRHVQIPINQETIGAIMTIGGDSMPVPINYKILGEEYRKALQALFDHGLDAAVEAKIAKWKQFEKMSEGVSI